jgi:hypothetical protein
MAGLAAGGPLCRRAGHAQSAVASLPRPPAASPPRRGRDGATAPMDGDELTEAQVVLRRPVNEQKPAGDYAATLVRDAGRPEMYFAFKDEGDARKFAAAVKAEAIGSHPGWASQRAFELDSARLAEIEASLPPPRTHVRQGQIDQSTLARRSRRGPWRPITRDD